ncbi:multidrug transporter AcrB [Alkalispirochaeta odontotermitis]|nr:multidrug transporter AcrB [Alkalispirochaeta odontotermitis]CAB1083218.1 RND efflux system, inner membrane transporter [Olavius algarvensis Delta 1 endosymbiont]
MNFAELSIKKSTITWTMTILLLVVGYLAYQGLPRLEDPEFAIKEAVVITPFPGASPREVEFEVTEKIEKAVQELGQLKRVESYSERGRSTVKVVIKDEYDMARLPQVWDELRRKVNDYQKQLPPGAGPSVINDDFGDTYGVYFALTGKGFTYAELKKVAELLKRELTTVTDVKKIVFFGEQQEAIYVELAKAKIAALGITVKEIFEALQVKNLPADAGRIKIGSEYMPIYPSGVFKSEKDFGDLLIGSQGGRLIYLKDIATIHRDYIDPPKNLLRINGQPALGIAISTVVGGNVVAMGQAVEKRFYELLPQIPWGMDLAIISNQAESVVKAINGFVVNLIEAVVIVIIVLLFFMGLRAGLIIGFILTLTIAATFVVMGYYEITLERISLGALIIALGMLVDNAIVVVDGMKVRMEQGMDGLQAAKEVVGQNSIPLLGATAVAILAFASIGGMNNNTGEFCRALFYVILISLSLSWLTAVTSTPLIAKTFLKTGSPQKSDNKKADPYAGKLYQLYRSGLTAAIRFRWMTIGAVIGLFALAIFGFGYLDNLFFPPSTRPQFMVEIQFREGIHIRETQQKVAKIEKYLDKTDGVTMTAAAIGAGHPRFLVTYNVPIDIGSHYSIILVSVEDYEIINQIFQTVQSDLEGMFPDAVINAKKFNLGPGAGGKIQLRINGPDPVELRRMADNTKAIIEGDPDAKAVRDEWGPKVKTVRPILAESRARRVGIDRRMVSERLQTNYTGTLAGVYREGIELIPIYARAPVSDRETVEDMADIPVISPVTREKIPFLQVVDHLVTANEDNRLSRYNRRPMIKVHADARYGLPSEVLNRVKPKIEQTLGVDAAAYLGRSVNTDGQNFTAGTIPIKYDDIVPLKNKPGYFIAWSGEAEDSADAITQLAASIPIYFGMMILVVIFLFNAFRQPLIIWLTVPLAIIGVTAGLLIFNQPFGFMALLGVMSLSGMLIKNAIVLIDQIDLEIREGKERFQAVVDSGVSRMMPVCMAALTTIMGMIPLLQDGFFVAMAVTIMFGLGFATVLTLVFVPVLYATFFKIPYKAVPAE